MTALVLALRPSHFWGERVSSLLAMPSSPPLHSRSSPLTLDGSDPAFLNVNPMALRSRRSARPSPDLDVWFQPPSHLNSPQPHISFPVSNPSSPFPRSATGSPAGYFSVKSSPTAPGYESPRPHAQSGLGLSWRDAGSEVRRRKGNGKQVLSFHQVLMGGGALFAVTVVYLLLRSGTSSPEVRRMGRGEHDRTYPRSSTIPAVFKVRPPISCPRRDAS